MSPRRDASGGSHLLALLVVLGVLVAAATGTTAENPAAELGEALRGLGPPGFLWGRLAVEEESPDGPWTPLSGVEVHAYPAVPSLLAELERIRQSARGSAVQYDTAVARLRAALSAYQAQVDAASRPTSPPPEDSGGAKGVGKAGGGTTGGKAVEKKPSQKNAAGGTASAEAIAGDARRRVTDPWGIFVFEDLPSGEWLLVAMRVTPYGPAKARPEPQRRDSGRDPRFLSKSGDPPKEAEVWLTRVRVSPGERVAIFLTDRARWVVGPLR